MKRWGWKGAISILDQAVFSGTNFLVSILLARLLQIDEFGAFAVGFAILTFLTQVYTSFSLEPMSVLGPSNYRDSLVSYLQAQVRLLFLLSAPTGLALGGFLWLNQSAAGHFVAAPALAFSAISLPFVLLPLLMRRGFYVLQSPSLALAGSVIYFLGLALAFSMLVYFDVLGAISSILVCSLAGFLSGLVMLFFLRQQEALQNPVHLGPLLRETWSFGRWLILSGLLIGLATQSQIYLTGVLTRVQDAADVRVLQTFIQPMMLTSTALSALATPAITADFAAGAYQLMRHKMLRFTFTLGAMALIYETLLLSLGGPLNDILFGDKYSSVTRQIPVWGLVPVILSFFWGGVITLQASQRPQAMLIIATCWALFSLVPALALIPAWGVWGATISILAGFLAAFVSTWVLYWRWVHQTYMVKRGRPGSV